MILDEMSEPKYQIGDRVVVIGNDPILPIDSRGEVIETYGEIRAVRVLVPLSPTNTIYCMVATVNYDDLKIDE